jgi:hypothetical protein
MRALRRHFLAPLLMAAAVLSAAPIALAAAPAASASVAHSRACPAGTNWDSSVQACV